MSERLLAPDHAARQRVIAERARNVLLDAGAGGGKTSLLVARLLDLVVPSDSARPALAMERSAAVTFTRRAAGELSTRIRESLLALLAEEPPETQRAAQARTALTALDTAAIGTIHSVADRLLRRYPLEAGLSPAYELCDDITPLVAETFADLHDACESGTLARELPSDAFPPSVLAETEATFRATFEAGFSLDVADRTQFNTEPGLPDLLAAWIQQRDRTPATVAVPAFPRAAFAALCAQFQHSARAFGGASPGVRWLHRMADLLDDIGADADPVTLYARLARPLGKPPKFQKAKHFDGAREPWDFYNLYKGGSQRPPKPGTTGTTGTRGKASEDSLRDRLMAPLEQQMAIRLARARPVALALYEQVKARHRAADQVDLLIKLRDVLRDHPPVRLAMQGLFDHIFVDEFQDTDPLQAEILLFLSEDGARATQWQDIEAAPGRLTLVGDPQQSVYRFRRADLRVYDTVREVLLRGGCLRETLTANFRSDPSLIAWCNARFADIFGHADSGGVAHAPMEPGRSTAGGARGARVRILSLDIPAKESVDITRAREARAIASHLHELVEGGACIIPDPRDGAPRPLRYGDIAVLAVTTTKLRLLLEAFDDAGVPSVASGGTLFAGDPLHRRFVLALCALANPLDGPAQASLALAPFTAVSLEEWGIHRTGGVAPGAVEAQALIDDVRRRAQSQPLGATLRALLEETAIERVVSREPNGAVRLARLRDFALELEVRALRDGHDLPTLAAAVREWADDPPQVSPAPLPDSDAVQVMSIHQAKGLEWPVVVVWDSRHKMDDTPRRVAWRVTHDDRAWAVAVGPLKWEEPAGGKILAYEKEQDRAERRRLLYVAVTRAREWLILTRGGAESDLKFIPNYLLNASPPGSIEDVVVTFATRTAPVAVTADGNGWHVARAAWTAEASAAVSAHDVPQAVAAAAGVSDIADATHRRHGAVFGTTVHQALGLLLAGRAPNAAAAVAQAANIAGLQAALTGDAIADVTRALATLREAGYTELPAGQCRLEYALGGRDANGAHLLHGFADLVARTHTSVDILDFKTDAPPSANGASITASYPAYAAQVRLYAQLLRDSGVAGLLPIRAGLLFSADGSLHWVD